ncbi:MAG TPA: hypothetical protein VM536_06090, partial [Chloroflexia bacterium]|nr:hypothetical protein [Chloroflexia bacterium]
AEHKQQRTPGFTQRYALTLLAYCESTPDVHAAIAREKPIKGWARAKKVALIETENPYWEDLSAGWYATEPYPGARTDSSLRSE